MMAESGELLFGKIAVKLKLLTQEQLNELVRIQETLPKPIPLGQLMKDQNLITEEQLRQLLDLQRRQMEMLDPRLKQKKEAILFGKLAVRLGLATIDQVNGCLREQAKHPPGTKTLGEVMVEMKVLTNEQVRQILARQQKRTMKCIPCKLTFTVVSTTGTADVKCPRCKRALSDLEADAPVRTDAEFQTMIAQAVDLQLQPKDFSSATTTNILHTKCPICDESFQGMKDSTGRVRCPKCLSSFTPKRGERS